MNLVKWLDHFASTLHIIPSDNCTNLTRFFVLNKIIHIKTLAHDTAFHTVLHSHQQCTGIPFILSTSLSTLVVF